MYTLLYSRPLYDIDLFKQKYAQTFKSDKFTMLVGSKMSSRLENSKAVAFLILSLRSIYPQASWEDKRPRTKARHSAEKQTGHKRKSPSRAMRKACSRSLFGHKKEMDSHPPFSPLIMPQPGVQVQGRAARHSCRSSCTGGSSGGEPLY